MTARKPGRPPIDPARIQAALRHIEDGASLTEAANTVGVSRWTLARHTPIRLTFQEAGSLGRAVRIHNQKVKL